MKRIIDRLSEYMDSKGLNDNQVTVQSNLSVGLIGKSKKSGKSLSGENIAKVIYTYRDLNPTWLLTGEGEMLIENGHIEQKNDSLTIHLKEEIKELKEEIKELRKENKLLIIENVELRTKNNLEKTDVQEEGDVGCAAVS